MNEEESVEGESAYGSETSSDSKASIKNDSFTTQESTPKKRKRCKKLKRKLREYTILEAIFSLILVFLLITCYRITSQNKETHKMISKIQSQLNSLQKPTEKDFVNLKREAEEMIKNEYEKIKAMSEEVMKEVRMKSNVKLEQSKSSINSTTNSEENDVPPVIPTVSTNSTLKRFNAASFIAGSRIDESLSTRLIPAPSSYYDKPPEFDMVLIDRPEPPANKAWCTLTRNPVLTVNLAKYINPTAVSYQHSKWNGTIPDDAPKEYSVEACLDYYCEKRKTLFSNCEYNPSGLQEQVCNKTSKNTIDSPVAKLQFRFHNNHGNERRTCVSLVRVYSETNEVPEQKLRSLKDTKECLDLSYRYHNYPMIYKYLDSKNCTVLYSKGCCQECPGCCEECKIEDPDEKFKEPIIFCVSSIFALAIFLFLFGDCFQKTTPQVNE